MILISYDYEGFMKMSFFSKFLFLLNDKGKRRFINDFIKSITHKSKSQFFDHSGCKLLIKIVLEKKQIIGIKSNMKRTHQ